MEIEKFLRGFGDLLYVLRNFPGSHCILSYNSVVWEVKGGSDEGPRGRVEETSLKLFFLIHSLLFRSVFLANLNKWLSIIFY